MDVLRGILVVFGVDLLRGVDTDQLIKVGATDSFIRLSYFEACVAVIGSYGCSL